MSQSPSKKDAEPSGKPPRKGRRREDQGTVSVSPINPPAVGGGGIQRGDGPHGPKPPKKA
jgi:hypothetical protein